MKFDKLVNKALQEADETSTGTEISDIEQLFEQLRGFLSKGARFASFIYKTNGTAGKGQEPNGPTKIYTVNLGVDYGAFKTHNQKVIEAYQPKDQWEEIAKKELLAPSAGVAPSSVYVTLGKGIRYNTEKDKLNILGQVSHTEEVAPGQEKAKVAVDFLAVNKDGTPRGGDKAHIARAKRMIQDALKDQLRKGLTSYDLDPAKIGGLKLSGQIIEFQSGEKPAN